MSLRLRANARHLAVPALLDGLVLAAFAGAMLTTGGATLDAAAIASLLFGGAIVAVAGSVIVAWTITDAYPSHHVMAILLGSLATSLVLFLGCVITGTLAAKVFLAWSAVVLVAGAWTLRAAPEVERRDGLDVLAIVTIAILVAALCHDAASTLPSIQATGIVPIWSDYSIHATEIAQFGDPHVQGLSSFLLAGQPLVFYHYASYMLPAAAAGFLSLPPWGVAASLLLPYGILLMSLAAYAFARVRLGAAAATLAPAALLFVPDASAYGLRNGFFGFHWLLLTAPGSGYGLGAAFTALTLMAVWRSNDRPACFWLGIFVAASAFEFRAQIFLLLVPALAASLLWETSFVQRQARAVILVAVLTAIAVIVCLVTWHGARDAWLRFSALRPFLDVVHSGMSPTAYDGTVHGHRAALRAASRDDARRDRAHSGCAGRVGPRAAGCLRGRGPTHRVARPRSVSDVVCRRVAGRGAIRADGEPRRLYRVSAATIRAGLCVGCRLDAPVRRARVARPWPFSRGSPPRTRHDAGRRDCDHCAGAAARGSGPPPLCLGHALLRHQARTRVHRRSRVRQNACRPGRHLCPDSDGRDERAGR